MSQTNTSSMPRIGRIVGFKLILMPFQLFKLSKWKKFQRNNLQQLKLIKGK